MCDSARVGSNKKWSSQALANAAKRTRDSRGGTSPTHPLKQVPKSVLLAVDGAQAWKRAADGCLILTGGNHEKKVFTPASKVAKRIQSRAKGPKKAAKQPKSSITALQVVTMLLKVSSVTSRKCSEKPTAKAGMQKQRCEAAKYGWTVLSFLSDLLAVKSKMISHSLSTQAGLVLEETAQTVSSMISITCTNFHWCHDKNV